MATRANSRRRAITALVLVVSLVVLYFVSGGLMDWLRVTVHGR
jgi:hypothetical protein